MSDADRVLGIDDLITAMCHYWRWRNAAPELSEYHRSRYQLLIDELGVDPEPLDLEARRRFDRRDGDDQLPGLVKEAAACRKAELKPFSGVLAAGPAFSAAYRDHRAELGELSEVTGRVNESIVRWCLVRLYPALEGRTTTEASAMRAGAAQRVRLPVVAVPPGARPVPGHLVFR